MPIMDILDWLPSQPSNLQPYEPDSKVSTKLESDYFCTAFDQGKLGAERHDAYMTTFVISTS